MAVQNVFGGELDYWSDIEPGPIAVMQHHYPDVPNLGDLKEIDWASLGHIDIVTAGYPCQPFSNAGLRKGLEDERHIWPYIAQGIGVLRPSLVVLENVSAHLRRGFDVVTQDLAEIGYDATWTTLRASDIGACHRRDRLWILATPQDTDVSARVQRWVAAPGQAESWGSRADAGGRGGVAPSEGELMLPAVAVQAHVRKEEADARSEEGRPGEGVREVRGADG